MSVNKTILVGNVGNLPETINFQNGGSMIKFSLATSETYKDKNGQKQTVTTWHNIEATGKIIDVIEKYVKKGDLLYIEGSIKNRSWEDNGVKKYATSIFLKELKMLGGKKESSQDNEQVDAPY